MSDVVKDGSIHEQRSALRDEQQQRRANNRWPQQKSNDKSANGRPTDSRIGVTEASFEPYICAIARATGRTRRPGVRLELGAPRKGRERYGDYRKNDGHCKFSRFGVGGWLQLCRIPPVTAAEPYV